MNLRPRFSIRTLLVLVTLVGVYFGCWEVTKRRGLESAVGSDDDTLTFPFDSSPGPFVITRMRYRLHGVARVSFPGIGATPFRADAHREYYGWFFGYVAKLPFEREVPP